MVADLVPVIGELNAERSDRPYGEVEGERREFGACDFEVDRSRRDGPVEPPDNVRGDLARIWLVMAAAYPDGLELTPDERELFERWSASDPVDEWERERARRIGGAHEGMP